MDYLDKSTRERKIPLSQMRTENGSVYFCYHLIEKNKNYYFLINYLSEL